jgi:hypothetical protein
MKLISKGSMAEIERALAAILAEARAQVAAGREPNMAGLEARIATALRRARSAGEDAAAVDELGAGARRKLAGVVAVGRARARLAREPQPPPTPRRQPARPFALRTKPTITGTLDVRRADGEGYELVWDAVPTVTEWEVRLSERPDLRSDYAERERFVLAATETSVKLPLGDNPFRVNVLGRGRGRLQRRALISGLTRESWRERWQRRPSAS